ncbi:uncharacterized protein [Euwallacea similis]|uniref:uncharacterized protein n=1 Tax=Euwallacea similis TaxID=1736056 RepID=UPI00344BC5EE
MNDPGVEQSAGTDPRSKRNSGLFAFFKWLKPGSRESVAAAEESSSSSRSASLESVASDKSSGTVASFRYVSPTAYENKVLCEKRVPIGPETDTYKARLEQRDKRRERDKNVTLRKKYNLFFQKETLLRPRKVLVEDENSKSLPLMTKARVMEADEPQKVHRRTNSESSKVKRAGAYLHVKGKRKAPQPPNKLPVDSSATASLKRKKRMAPTPPPTTEKEVLTNDCLKLDHGVLKPLKEEPRPKTPQESQLTVAQTLVKDAPVSPRPWYKRNSVSKEILVKKESKYEPIERLPEVPFVRNSSLDLTLEDPATADYHSTKKKEEKRKSGVSFLPNISELDREATEIVRSKHQLDESKIPQFMKLKDTRQSLEESPRRRSAKDLIAKFNAITSKSSVFQRHLGKQVSLDEASRQRQEQLLESHKKCIEDIDRRKEDKFAPLMKSESASAVKLEGTPKVERKSWKCPKCNLENEYWRIICQVCSAIKPYFDDFSSAPSSPKMSSVTPPRDAAFERSKTQIGFSALANYNNNEEKVDNSSKKEERERLKKMLIEMKNSLPKRKSHMLQKQNGRSSVIVEEEAKSQSAEKTQEEKVAEILIGTTQTIYENVRVRRTDQPKPLKVSSAAQTSAVVRKVVPQTTLKKLIENHKTENVYEPMKVQDFEDIYAADGGENAVARVYANLARNDELSLFFNVPKGVANLRNGGRIAHNNTDTLEINRLLRRLETSIAKGEMVEAANFAKELALLKVNCSVIRQKSLDGAKGRGGLQIEMYVEDKVSHRGPFPIDVTETQTVAELKQQICREFEIPVEVQRWILGKQLVVEDTSTLKDHKITQGSAVFLYLVAPEKKPREQSNAINTPVPSTSKLLPNITKEIITVEKTSKIEAPKVVNVIPKSSETPPPPATAPVQKTPVTPPTPKIANIPPPTIPKLPVASATEIKVEIKPNFTRTQPDENRPSGLVRATASKVEVLQAFPILPHPKEWECHLCTLLNPDSSNICAVCAAVRLKQQKKMAPKVPQPQTYMQLVSLDSADVVPNADKFECLVCFLEVAPNEGVTLRECLHQFCRDCLARTVEFCDEAEVKCPYRDDKYSCEIALQEREIKALVSKELYELHLAKSVAEAENRMEKTFHCKTPDCKGWCIFEDNVNEFRCPVCRKINCLTCQAIHMGANCKQYQQRMKDESDMNEDARRTKDFLEEMVDKGEAIACPTCKVILMKKWGCDWLRCSMCKTEICWVTRGPRWGPGGKGDTTSGCRCGVNGVKCHPKCNYCH